MLDLPAFVLGLAPSFYWRVGEASGTTAADATGQGRVGTYIGGFTLGQQGAIANDADDAVLLDGINGRASSTFALFAPGVPFTVVAWAKTIDSRNAPNCALWGGASSGSEVYLRVNPSNGDVRFTPNRAAANPAATWAQAISQPRAFHCVGFNFDDASDTAELFVDGESAGTRSIAHALSAKSFMLGHDSVGDTFPGTADEVAGWKGVQLDAATHRRLFSLGLFRGALALDGFAASGVGYASAPPGVLGLNGSAGSELEATPRGPRTDPRTPVRAVGRGKVRGR